MATSPMAAYRVVEEQIPSKISLGTSVPRIEVTTPDTGIDDGLGAARGILVGLVLCVPFWVGVYAMLF